MWNFIERQDIEGVRIIAIEESEMGVVPDDFSSVIKIISVALGSILEHLLDTSVSFDFVDGLEFVIFDEGTQLLGN